MKNKILLLCLIVLAFCLTGCSKKSEDKIPLDSTYPLALAPDVTWVLITDPYAAYKIKMDWNSDNAGHCRRGEILQVLGKSYDDENFLWYKVENGWLPSSCLKEYSNRYKAQTAAEALKDL